MIDWDFIIGVGVVTGILLPIVLHCSPKINSHIQSKKKQFFDNVRQYTPTVDEELFEDWIKEYFQLGDIGRQLDKFLKFGVILVATLIIGSFHSYIPDDFFGFTLMVYTVIIWCMIIFGISFVSIIWWYKQNSSEKT